MRVNEKKGKISIKWYKKGENEQKKRRERKKEERRKKRGERNKEERRKIDY